VTVVLDTGPWLAALFRRDRHHRWSVDVLETLRPPLVSCEAVLSEVCFLLRADATARLRALEFVERQVVSLVPLGGEVTAIEALMGKYADVPMSFADGCVVRLTELVAKPEVFTCDRDFQRYRRNGRQVIALRAPFD